MYSSVPSAPPSASWNPGEQRIDPSPAPVSPTSPARSGRLRGLSYLRNYTSNRHSSSNSNSQNRPSTLGRATSYPSPTPRGSAASPAASPNPTSQQTSATATAAAQRATSEAPTPKPNSQESLGTTSGWLPSVGGQSGVSRIATEPQSTATPASSALLSANNPSLVTSDLTASMARTRSATTSAAETPQNPLDASGVPVEPDHSRLTGLMMHQLPSIRFTAHQDPRATRPSLMFSPMLRILPTGGEIIKVGRYSERDHPPPYAQNAQIPSSSPVGFKSKVVSRRHCEFWASNGQWYIRDVKSSSGTFLNHIRLSSPNTESRPFPVKDGDIVQLGIDFKGGEEMIFRCVKIRVELNKGGQSGPSQFNVQSHKRLQELNSSTKPLASGPSNDCTICLGSIAPCQSLFVAPCSHTWHYKCIRVIINGPHWPHFICPNCRSVADLEAELDDSYVDAEGEKKEGDTEGTVQQQPESNGADPVDTEERRENNVTDVTVTESHTDQPNGVGDMELGDASEDSEGDRRMNQVPEEQLDDHPSPSHSPDPEAHDISSATVAPVNIIPRRPVGGSSADSTSHLEQPNYRERNARTPSPNGLGSSLHETSIVAEGPMTPRNDVGPFIFDGSGGRIVGERIANHAAMNLDAAADTPPPELAAEPVS